MARFQAQTNTLLDEELDDLRERLGLRENQKADLLREITTLAGWVLRQTEAGRRIYARRGQDVEQLANATVERIRREHVHEPPTRIELDDSELERLADVLDRRFTPTPGLQKALLRLADPKKRPAPTLRWRKAKS